MNHAQRIHPIVLGAAGMLLFMLSGAASASGYWHPAPSETGVTTEPGHFQSAMTREQVRDEAIAAMRNGEMWRVTESGEPPRVSPARTLPPPARKAAGATQSGAAE